MNAKRRGFQLTNLILMFEAEPMTLASGVQNQQSALYGLPSIHPLKASIALSKLLMLSK